MLQNQKDPLSTREDPVGIEIKALASLTKTKSEGMDAECSSAPVLFCYYSSNRALFTNINPGQLFLAAAYFH